MAALNRRRDTGLLVVAAVLAGALLPAWLGGPDLDRTAAALCLAAPAAGAALTLAAGRPNLAVGALAGLGAYTSGALATRGLDVPLCVLVAVLTCAAGGAIVGLLTSRLDVVGLLAFTLLLALALMALTQALPQLSGGQAGLGPLPPLGSSLPGNRIGQLTASGDLHATLAVAVLAVLAASALLRGTAGARWRAVGSDRQRAASSGLRPWRAELDALVIAGALAGLGGALSAHVTRVATPDLFSPDTVALPLLAALLAGRGRAIDAAAAAVGTGLIGAVILPDLGWHGPPSASAVALALLGVTVVASLLPAPARSVRADPVSLDGDAPWPFDGDAFDGAALEVHALTVRRGLLTLLSDFSMRVEPGEVHGLVGPNGSGKSSLLASLLASPPAVVTLDRRGVIVLQPQSGGGFPACTVDETLRLAAEGGGRHGTEMLRVAGLWRERLALPGAALCAELSWGRRRLLDLARVLLRRPAVLLCDEPFAGLDPGARVAAVSMLRAAAAAGLTIIVAEHDREALRALAVRSTELGRPDLVVAAGQAL